MIDVGDKREGIKCGCKYDKNGELLSFRVPGSLDHTLLYLVQWPSGDLVGVYNIVDYAPRGYFYGTRSWI